MVYTDGSNITSQGKDTQQAGAYFFLPKNGKNPSERAACTINPKGHKPINTINLEGLQWWPTARDSG
eukprot:1156393-Pelagomonas_calceolata.AAC.14